MTITDYETGRKLRDVGMSLTFEEATELRDYLNRLLADPQLSHAFLSEISCKGLEKELAIRIDGPRPAAAATARRLPLPRQRPIPAA